MFLTHICINQHTQRQVFELIYNESVYQNLYALYAF